LNANVLFFAGFGPSGASITTMPMFSFPSWDPYSCKALPLGL
jgi:hypothetical protein